MRAPLVVRVVGAHLECLAWESLLSGVPEVRLSHDCAPVASGGVTVLIGILHLSRARQRTDQPSRPGVALVTRGAAAELLEAVQQGIEVMVSPEDSLPVLLEALCAAASGNAHCSARLLPALLDVIRSRSAVNAEAIEGAPSSLSPREEEIAALVATGLTNGQVARQLHVEERTVKSHLTSVYSKLSLAGRSDLRARWPALPKRYV
ncbi:MAG: response regulator transcription factor [Actinomycetota bacterium]